MLNPELYAPIKQNKPAHKVFKVDAIFPKHGHSVLQVPLYDLHPNPTEMIWAIVKKHVTK